MKSFPIFAFALFICSAAHAQNATAQNATAQNATAQNATAQNAVQTDLRTLIISGGPSVEYNQYAIESNARYVEKLTAKSAWRRIYFADGKPNSRTISAIVDTPQTRAARALALVLDEDLPRDSIVVQASALPRIDGASTKTAVLGVLGAFAQPQANQSGLLYFTGHGNAGGNQYRPDYNNTTYALWNDENISEREVASAIKNWPARNPLFVVAVQCHSGGFGNLIFQDGDPKKPLLDRDIAGFFSSTGQRMAAGCTNEVNERDYQDFTTHFFAALSGVSRDGRAISGADYDRNGAVSGSEAFAYANVHDLSIDVPVSTSDVYLRSIYGQSEAWKNTPYSQILANAQPWQKAMLNELSGALALSGETRIQNALATFQKLSKKPESAANSALSDAQEKAINQKLSGLQSQLYQRFPNLKAPKNSAKKRAAKRAATLWLVKQPAQVGALDDAIAKYQRAQDNGDVKLAMLERFVRGSYSVVLGQRVRREGTPAQQAAFAKLRAAETRNPLT